MDNPDMRELIFMQGKHHALTNITFTEAQIHFGVFILKKKKKKNHTPDELWLLQTMYFFTLLLKDKIISPLKKTKFLLSTSQEFFFKSRESSTQRFWERWPYFTLHTDTEHFQKARKTRSRILSS